uniref:NAD(P)/FAD-dependent oxidoreductase n=1 Tax=Eiseniibacteriota bacterium TaxID=2212470 RepID=A0A832MK11_UNCEI
MTELLVVGAGPAGISAALWARWFGLEVRVVDAGASPGGQLHRVHFHPRTLAGIPVGDGPAIAAVMARQLADAGVAVRGECTAQRLEPGARPAVILEGGERLACQAVLIATGVRRRRLGVPGEDALEGRGVSFSATRDRAQLAGRRVLVVGGGDAAYENALILAGAGCRVVLAVRDAPRARAEFRARVARTPAIEVRRGVRVTAILGTDAVTGVRLAGPEGVADVAVEGVVVKVGVVPNTEWCRDAVACDDAGHVRAGEHGRTSAPRVWAAGDVTGPALPSVAVAMGQAAAAVADARRALRED